MDLPAEVRELTGRHLAAADARAPGLLAGLYLTGSVALGDFRPNCSDIDFIGILGAAPTDGGLQMLAEVHADLDGPRPYDGFYLSPGAPVTVARIHEGVFSIDAPATELEPVPRLELARYGVPARGPSPPPVGPPDGQQLNRWLVGNLAGYWAQLTDQVEQAIDGRPGETPTFSDSVTWIVLGPARLHFTLATGDLVSKSAVAPYIAERFPAWAELAERCRRHRQGDDVPFLTRDLTAAVDLTRTVRADAEGCWADRG